MASNRQVVISAVQYDEELRAGKLSLVDMVRRAKRLGADGVEFRETHWNDKAREIAAIRAVVNELGLIATYATYATIFSNDPDGQKRLRQDVDDAKALGSPLLRIFQGEAPGPRERTRWDSARAALNYAAERGVVLALENFAKQPGCHLADIKSVLDQIQLPSLRTNVDIGNYALNGEDLPNVVRTLGPRIISSHIKDNVETPNGSDATYLGGGSLPLKETLAEFDKLPQKIIHCFEFGGGGDPDGRIQKSLAFLKEN